LGLFGFGAFGATAAEQGRSFVAEHMGEIVAAPAFSLWDDALDPAGLPMPFDAEGVPKQRVDLIKSGRAAGVCFNLATAKRAGRSSTGHALPAPNPQGPLPYSLVMAAGEASRQDLIGGIRRGLLISRCHGFIAPLNSRNGTLSGTTRDGTFLVEGGEIVAPVKNFRWTVSAVDTFKTLEAASSERSLEFNDLFGFFPTTSLLPSVRLGRFRIDGVQPHE
jgi:PmbA protein